jgi:predicted dienelactone hydrolase
MMVRIFYVVLLRLHPKSFQVRFGNQMLLTFEEARDTEGSARMLLDAVLSLFRQRFLRSHFNHRLPAQAIAGVAGLNNSPRLGLSPYRFFQGGLISLALFLTVCLCIRGGKTLRDAGFIGQDGTGVHAQPLTPSDLATIHVECAQQTRNGCSSERPAVPGIPDEMMDLQPAIAQRPDTHELLLPSGPFSVGRVLYEWPEDPELIVGRPQAQRRAAFVWYPSSVEQPTATPLMSAWNYSRANRLLVQTHTLEKPPIAKGSNLFPVLLFYPSMNSSSAAYTTQIENLVSHGYVVASLEPLTDQSVISFPNGQLLPFAADLRAAYRAGKPPFRGPFLKQAIDESFARKKSLAADLSFLLNRLTVINQASRADAPFAGRLDFSRVGALGHSDGGTAAGLACKLDQRISACLSEDGWTPNGPSPEIAPATAPSRPFMWINIPLAPTDNEQLTYLHMERTEFDSLARESQIQANQELNSLQNGAYRVTVRLPDVTDDYFTDGPFVWSMLNPQGNIPARNVLVIVNTYMRAFFDHYLRGGSNELLDGSALPLRNVEVKRYSTSPPS